MLGRRYFGTFEKKMKERIWSIFDTPFSCLFFNGNDLISRARHRIFHCLPFWPYDFWFQSTVNQIFFFFCTCPLWQAFGSAGLFLVPCTPLNITTYSAHEGPLLPVLETSINHQEEPQHTEYAEAHGPEGIKALAVLLVVVVFKGEKTVLKWLKKTKRFRRWRNSLGPIHTKAYTTQLSLSQNLSVCLSGLFVCLCGLVCLCLVSLVYCILRIIFSDSEPWLR